MTRSTDNPGLNRFAWFTAAATWWLICMGGLVTSHEAGLSVPDWPNSYGYNMFLFPVSKWVGNIFYEHTHRLVASGVGFLTIILTVWLWRKESRRWLRWLGVGALVAVVAQGVLGGLRVTLLEYQLGIFHAVLGQLFFVLMVMIALATSPLWRRWTSAPPLGKDRGALRPLVLGSTLLILGQLVLGATMRQQHAGLAIPDFPLAYGKLWPDTDPHSVQVYNQNRVEAISVNPITADQIILQMVHRLVALTILGGVVTVFFLVRRYVGRGNALFYGAFAWVSLLLIQIGLGAWTILSGKAADVATAHVGVGAICLAWGAVLTVLAYQRVAPAGSSVIVPASSVPYAPVPGAIRRSS